MTPNFQISLVLKLSLGAKIFLTLFCYRFRWRALYKGLAPKIMRLGPGGAIMLVVYEHVYHLLKEKFG